MIQSVKQFLKRNQTISYYNSLLKGFFQQRLAARTLAQYHQRAEDLHLPEYDEAELRTALAERLRERGLIPQGKYRGDLHIFFAYALENWERVLAPALGCFGQVTEFEWTSLGFDHHAADWLSVRDDMNRQMLAAFHQANSESPVDAVFGYLSGYTMDPNILAKMGRTGAVIFNFSLDDKLHFPGKVVGGRYTNAASLANVVDLNLTNAPQSIIKYMVHGGLAAFWPEAASPAVHKPYDCDFEFDVSFIGKCYGWRPRFIRRLTKMGIPVECFGTGWPNGPLSDDQMVKLYSRSRINLGFAGVAHSRRLMCLKGRDFEVPASGGLYLTQDNPELSLVYDIGREIVTYTDERNCVEQIHRLLADPQRAQRIRLAGQRRALAQHTWQHRFEQIFTLAGLLRQKVMKPENTRALKGRTEIQRVSFHF
ncbi:MAG: glycosyltransferase [Actinobacteria bacterium]|nr:glycosyltransferase [Actinomycetota bacterium]